jgi:hypothetical protein
MPVSSFTALRCPLCDRIGERLASHLLMRHGLRTFNTEGTTYIYDLINSGQDWEAIVKEAYAIKLLSE